MGALAQPAPDVISLIQVHESLYEVAVLVYPSLNYTFHILFQLFSSHLNEDAKRISASLLHLPDVRTFYFNPAILYFIRLSQFSELCFCFYLRSPQLNVHVFFSYSLSLILRTNIEWKFHILIPPQRFNEFI